MTEIPEWLPISLAAIFIGILGTYFDKYLLQKYFASDQEESGVGALVIFSAYFLIFPIAVLWTFFYQVINFSLLVGSLGLIVGAVNGLWILLYLHALNRTEVERAIPIFQTVPFFGFLFAYMFLGELLTPQQIAAALLIIAGGTILMFQDRQGGRIDITTLGLMLVASALVALSQTLFKLISEDINFWTATFWLWAGFILFGVAIHNFAKKYDQQFSHLISTRISSLKEVLSANALNELFDNVGEIVFLLAVTIGPIALVQASNAYEPFIALVLAALMAVFFPHYFSYKRTVREQCFIVAGILTITGGSVLLYAI